MRFKKHILNATRTFFSAFNIQEYRGNLECQYKSVYRQHGLITGFPRLRKRALLFRHISDSAGTAFRTKSTVPLKRC